MNENNKCCEQNTHSGFGLLIAVVLYILLVIILSSLGTC